MVSIKRLVVGPLSSNSYLIYDRECMEGVLIDAGGDPEKIIELIDGLRVDVKLMLATHGHFDHVLGVKHVREELECKFLMHKDDLWLLEESAFYAKMYVDSVEIAEPDGFLDEGYRVSFGKHTLRVLHTPGHTPGSLCFLGEGFIMTGDTLFAGTVGRTDLPGGSWEQLACSILDKLMSLPDDCIVYPGHGEHTSIGRERMSNPYIIRLIRPR